VNAVKDFGHQLTHRMNGGVNRANGAVSKPCHLLSVQIRAA
jgi:hypothetical protein